VGRARPSRCRAEGLAALAPVRDHKGTPAASARAAGLPGTVDRHGAAGYVAVVCSRYVLFRDGRKTKVSNKMDHLIASDPEPECGPASASPMPDQGTDHTPRAFDSQRKMRVAMYSGRVHTGGMPDVSA